MEKHLPTKKTEDDKQKNPEKNHRNPQMHVDKKPTETWLPRALFCEKKKKKPLGDTLSPTNHRHFVQLAVLGHLEEQMWNINNLFFQAIRLAITTESRK